MSSTYLLIAAIVCATVAFSATVDKNKKKK
ncbi:hypothetical protein CLOBY_43640 [Clostridium saccharobutylicum]|nr:hypothetical protein CLOSC_44260 [Clostridium saccharobutylicum]OAV42111.1 hypothetical protein M945_0467 [Clostridium saccharobutylicum DSM 13864]AQS02575.1 hypothetical protein CSACC_44310 [Clostridium saccharobutylicum]AQS12181.1 hypothetical protein CLOBY_43640 [Clostridium saccharobutylicum]AQS16558.1 hypothetical protein CLOSACC_44310 [Clostridium saccharobutylicum]